MLIDLPMTLAESRTYFYAQLAEHGITSIDYLFDEPLTQPWESHEHYWAEEAKRRGTSKRKLLK